MFKFSFFLFLSLFFITPQAFAQILDMRAHSRQQGFKASPVQQQYFPQTRRIRPLPSAQQAPLKQEEKNQTGFKQTGIKIFQEKDENKVMNFKIENPEFDKLSKSEQNDILKRIVIKPIEH